MNAVFQLSGFQYAVTEGALLKVPFQNSEIGSKLEINEVMLITADDKTQAGTPFIPNAKIEAEVTSVGKNEKVEIYKYKRRTKYRRRQGHRQDYTEIKINKIILPQA